MMTGAFSQNVGKLFSELKLVTDNLFYQCKTTTLMKTTTIFVITVVVVVVVYVCLREGEAHFDNVTKKVLLQNFQDLASIHNWIHHLVSYKHNTCLIPTPLQNHFSTRLEKIPCAQTLPSHEENSQVQEVKFL